MSQVGCDLFWVPKIILKCLAGKPGKVQLFWFKKWNLFGNSFPLLPSHSPPVGLSVCLSHCKIWPLVSNNSCKQQWTKTTFRLFSWTGNIINLKFKRGKKKSLTFYDVTKLSNHYGHALRLLFFNSFVSSKQWGQQSKRRKKYDHEFHDINFYAGIKSRIIYFRAT